MQAGMTYDIAISYSTVIMAKQMPGINQDIRVRYLTREDEIHIQDYIDQAYIIVEGVLRQ